MGVNFFDEQVPDATTLLKFRHLREKNNIGKVFFDAISDTLTKCGYMMRGGTIVDATLIAQHDAVGINTLVRPESQKNCCSGLIAIIEDIS